MINYQSMHKISDCKIKYYISNANTSNRGISIGKTTIIIVIDFEYDINFLISWCQNLYQNFCESGVIGFTIGYFIR